MPLCSSSCFSQINQYILNCNKSVKPGGISHFVFKLCTVAIPDYCDPNNWITNIDAKRIVVSGPVMAGKPAASNSKRQIYRCRPEQIISSTKTIDFMDYNNTCNGNYDFWNDISMYPTKYQVGWFHCDGSFYGFYNFTLEIDEVIEDTNKGSTYKVGKITILHLNMLKPRVIPYGMLDYLIEETIFVGSFVLPEGMDDNNCFC